MSNDHKYVARARIEGKPTFYWPSTEEVKRNPHGTGLVDLDGAEVFDTTEEAEQALAIMRDIDEKAVARAILPPSKISYDVVTLAEARADPGVPWPERDEPTAPAVDADAFVVRSQSLLQDLYYWPSEERALEVVAANVLGQPLPRTNELQHAKRHATLAEAERSLAAMNRSMTKAIETWQAVHGGTSETNASLSMIFRNEICTVREALERPSLWPEINDVGRGAFTKEELASFVACYVKSDGWTNAFYLCHPSRARLRSTLGQSGHSPLCDALLHSTKKAAEENLAILRTRLSAEMLEGVTASVVTLGEALTRWHAATTARLAKKTVDDHERKRPDPSMNALAPLALFGGSDSLPWWAQALMFAVLIAFHWWLHGHVYRRGRAAGYRLGFVNGRFHELRAMQALMDKHGIGAATEPRLVRALNEKLSVEGCRCGHERVVDAEGS